MGKKPYATENRIRLFFFYSGYFFPFRSKSFAFAKEAFVNEAPLSIRATSFVRSSSVSCLMRVMVRSSVSSLYT